MKLIPDSQLYQKLEKWLEALLMTAGVLAMGYYFNRSDPFLVHGSFPWIWFAPLLIALRYGIAPGMVTVISICLTYLAMLKLGMLTGDFPTTYMLGGVLITLICGQFSTLWDQRLRRANQLSSHAGERFEQLSRAYFMVRLSHDRLEQNLISRPVTLRDAMMDLRMLLAVRGGELDKETQSWSITAAWKALRSIPATRVFRRINRWPRVAAALRCIRMTCCCALCWRKARPPINR